MKVSEIKTPVSSVTGVGPQLTKTLARLNIFTAGDLLSYYPRDYEDRSVKIPLRDFDKHKKIHTVARVLSHEWFGYGKMKTLKVIIFDGTANAELICFNRSFLEKSLAPGAIVTVTGQFFIKYGRLQSSVFEVTKMDVHPENNEVQSQDFAKMMPLNSGVVPVYRLTEGLTQKTLSKVISNTIAQYAHGIENDIPDYLIQKHGLLSKSQALIAVHHPSDMAQALLARKTLIFEELFFFQYAIAKRAIRHRGVLPSLEFSPEALSNKSDSVSSSEGSLQKESQVSGVKNLSDREISDFDFEQTLSPLQKKLLEKIPFSLTADQKKVIMQMDEEIDRGYTERNKILNLSFSNVAQALRMPPPFTMARLLQGDVGSGKTLTAIFVCLRVINWKGQCAIMAPTEILARQHAETVSKMLDCIGVRTAFLTGKVKSSGRTQLLKALKEGQIDIVIGTHALFSSDVAYNDLQLAVIDEQHRFGVLQRQAIIAKGRVSEKNGITFDPHLLMMSATPIPQTLAHTVFGDLDVSVIKSMPAGRKPVQTYLVKEGNEAKAYDAVRKELSKGHQAYLVYPAISGEDEISDSDDNTVLESAGSSSRRLKSAEMNFKKLAGEIFPEYRCALVHSKISEEEQVRILEEFHDGKIQVLVATTVIEVGVDVPNATCMVIEQADCFGMAQLHQLRGRVGRGADQAICVLIYSKNLTETGIERMKVLRQSTDGFYIAEQDLKTRGPGEITGTLQAGNLEFAIADIVRDKDLLTLARADAFDYAKTRI